MAKKIYKRTCYGLTRCEIHHSEWVRGQAICKAETAMRAAARKVRS